MGAEFSKKQSSVDQRGMCQPLGVGLTPMSPRTSESRHWHRLYADYRGLHASNSFWLLSVVTMPRRYLQ
jgi:hypothetical protein